ncbi:Copper-transporting ATPase PAA1, chloroplastic, partial [Tetrabaena socialis]
MPIRDKVTAGTVNCDGALTVRAEHSGQQTVIADIVRMVEAAQARTAPIQRLADTVAGKFAYGVMGLSAATFAFWALAGTRLFPQVLAPAAAGPAGTLLLAAQMACNVLVTACPCALGLATPTAVLVGTSAGARRGLLIRGGDILEAASHVDTVVFDKTGTLTVGKPQVTHVHSLLPAEALGGAAGADAVLQLAAAAERRTTHPVAQALVRAADQLQPHAGAGGQQQQQQQAQQQAQQEASDPHQQQQQQQPQRRQQPLDLHVTDGSFSQEPGSGVAAVVGGRRVAVGTIEWLQRQGADVEAAAAALEAYGAVGATASSAVQSAVQGVGNSHTRVYVAVDGAVAGVIDVADAVRHDAAETVARLHRQGIRTVMLSGDKAAAAAEVAAAVGIGAADVFSDVKPAGKKAVVERLRGEGRVVAMVGDGINDTAALAAANVGVAMGGGVDAASEVAAVVLMGDQLSQVADAVHLARRTLAKINQNLVWAFGYNLIAIPLAAGALLPSAGICLTPSISGALMGLSSLGVVGNSLLLQLEVANMGMAGGVAASPAAAGAGDVAPAPSRVGAAVGGVVAAAAGAEPGGSRGGVPQMLASVVTWSASSAAGAGGTPPVGPPGVAAGGAGVDGVDYNSRLLKDCLKDYSLGIQRLNVQRVGNSHTRVYVAVDGAVAGVIDVADAVRHDAAETVARLHRQGIRTVMLSGDKAAAAAEVAATVGIGTADVFSDVKPAGKKAVVERLRWEGRVVAMVGDGINDTAALAAANVSVAMGGGVDAASEVAAVVLMGDQLSQ